MYSFQKLLIDIVLILFPLLMYLIYSMHEDNFKQEKNLLWFDFALISALYLNLSEGYYVMLNFIPLVLAYIKRRNLAILAISSLIFFDNSSLIIALGLILYFLIFNLIKNKNKKTVYFVFITILLFLDFSYSYLFEIVTFITSLYLLIHLYVNIESIIKLHITAKEIVKEETFQNSLFKITHEIKNPIAVCKGYLDMFDFENKNHKKYIKILKGEMDKILLLLQDFSAMKNIKINKELIDVNILIEEIISQFEPLLNNICDEFTYSLIDDEIYIEGDYKRLTQVFVNLIKNAVESKSKTLDIKVNVDGKLILIIIKDTGSGFNISDLNKIKEPFYTTKHNGSGLGVSLSCEILKAHEGKIEYKSALKKGTTVTVSLPIKDLE